MTMHHFLLEFEEFCKQPGVESGTARSYTYAIAYLCDFLGITTIDAQTVAYIRSIENDIRNKNSTLYQELLLFLTRRGQKSYLSKGWIRSGLTHFFDYVTQK